MSSDLFLELRQCKARGYKWVYVKKRNEKNENVGYKVRLIAQGFSQKPRVDYNETY